MPFFQTLLSQGMITLFLTPYICIDSICYRELEQDVEMVVKVLQPGRLGIVEHKFSAEEIQEAKTTVERSIENWRRIAALEKHGHVVRGGEK